MTADRIRTTISLPPDVYAVFKRMADAAGMSVSRCMGDWLADTCDAAEIITHQLEQARRSPMKALQEMKALVAGLGHAVTETGGVIETLQERERTARASARTARIARHAAADLVIPPSSNTGGKSPRTGKSAQAPRGKK
jgi:hypothetical protein